jgi:hypothetical protein
VVNGKSFKVLITLAAVTCAVAIAACGSSAKPSRATGSTGIGQGVAYADCMRSHGVPNFPDPSAGGGYSVSPEINVSSPAFASAQQACAKYGFSTPGPHGFSESQRLKLVKLARCMRAHDVPNFPDPSTTNVPTAQLALSSGIDPQSPAFRHAAAGCGAPGLWYRL